MKRRDLLAAAAAAACWPRGLARAANGPRKRVAIFSNVEQRYTEEDLGPVIKELARRGYADGERIEVKWYALEAMKGNLDERARAIVASNPDVILTMGTRCTTSARKATASIPIVTYVGDMVGLGFAESLAKPGGNITGYSGGLAEGAAKQVELARALIPKLDRVAVFHLDRDEEKALAGFAEQAIRRAQLEPVMVAVPRKEARFGALFRGLARKGVRGGIWGEVYFVELDVALRATLEERFPLVTSHEDLVERGMLAARFPLLADAAQQLAASVEQVLRGASPATIPIRYPERFRTVINRRAADANGIRLGPEFLLRADKVYE